MVSSASPYQRVLAIAEAAETMAELHRTNIYHVTSSPNLVYYNDRCCVSISVWLTIPGKKILQARENSLDLMDYGAEVRRKGASADACPLMSIPGKESLDLLKGVPLGFDGELHKIVIYPSHHFSLPDIQGQLDVLSLCCHFKTNQISVLQWTVRGWTSTMGRCWLQIITSAIRSVWRELFADLFPLAYRDKLHGPI